MFFFLSAVNEYGRIIFNAELYSIICYIITIAIFSSCEIKRKNPHSAERGFQPELLNRLCKQREDISYCPCCEKAEHNSEHKAVEQPAFYSVADQEIYSHKRKRPKHRMKMKRTCKIKM